MRGVVGGWWLRRKRDSGRVEQGQCGEEARDATRDIDNEEDELERLEQTCRGGRGREEEGGL